MAKFLANVLAAIVAGVLVALIAVAVGEHASLTDSDSKDIRFINV